MSESFTREELETAAQRLGHSLAMNRVLHIVEGTSLRPELLERALGYKCEWLSNIIAEARRLRQPPIANDEDELTVGELRAWLERKLTSPSRLQVTMFLTRDSIDKIMADIHAHREPGYPEGTVVQDAHNGKWLRHDGAWLRVADSPVSHSYPQRPLKVNP